MELLLEVVSAALVDALFALKSLLGFEYIVHTPFDRPLASSPAVSNSFPCRMLIASSQNNCGLTLLFQHSLLVIQIICTIPSTMLQRQSGWQMTKTSRFGRMCENLTTQVTIPNVHQQHNNGRMTLGSPSTLSSTSPHHSRLGALARDRHTPAPAASPPPALSGRVPIAHILAIPYWFCWKDD